MKEVDQLAQKFRTAWYVLAAGDAQAMERLILTASAIDRLNSSQMVAFIRLKVAGMQSASGSDRRLPRTTMEIAFAVLSQSGSGQVLVV